MTATRAYQASYWDVPHSQQPLRVRDRRRRTESPQPRTSVLDELVIGHLFHPLDARAPLPAPDYAELRDAANECEHGRLPGDRTDPCGCWGIAKREPLTWPVLEFSTSPIPRSLVLDASQFVEQGYTLRKVATWILHLTDCEDVPACEAELRARVEALHAR